MLGAEYDIDTECKMGRLLLFVYVEERFFIYPTSAISDSRLDFILLSWLRAK